MSKDFTFDVVSKVDMNIVDESVQVVLKEITNRFDFRGTDTQIKLDAKAGTILVQSADEFKVNAVLDVMNTRLAKRGLPLKNFQPGKIESALGGTAKTLVTITQGIPKDKAKDIVAAIKKTGYKV